MVSSVFREYRSRGCKNLWMMECDIFEGNPDVDRVVPDNWRVEKYYSFFNRSPEFYLMEIGLEIQTD